MSSLKEMLRLISGSLSDKGVDCLLIGGFAVNYYGYTRNTLDVDFMVVTDQMGAVEALMQRAGYVNVERLANVHFFSHPSSKWRVDFLKVDTETMRQLYSRAVEARVHEVPIKLPALADLLAMKLHALSHDPARRMGKDLPDIAWLCIVNEVDTEQLLRPLCQKFASPAIERQVFELIKALQS